MPAIRRIVCLFLLLYAAGGLSPARAATRTWTGGGTNSVWSLAGNWGGTAPTTNDLVSFGGTNRLVNTNDLAAGLPLNGLTFIGSAGAFSLAGSSIALGGGVTNASTNAQSVGIAMALSATQTVAVTGGNLTLSGALSGAGGVTKAGTGVLILSGASTYAGAVAVNAGTLKAGSGTALGTTNGSTVVASGATLDVGGMNLGGEPVTIAGTGVGGAGALVNTGAGQNNALVKVTLATNATVGGSGRFDLRSSTNGTALLDLAGYTLTKISTNQFSVVSGGIADGSLVVNAGLLSIETSTVCTGNVGTITINPGATLQLYQNPAGKVTRPIVLNGGRIYAYPTASPTNDSPITLAAGMTNTFEAASRLVLNGAVQGDALTKTSTNTLVLPYANTYTGGTAIAAGAIAIGSDGSLGGGALAFTGAGTLATWGGARTLTNTVSAGNVAYTFDTAAGDLVLRGSVTGSGAAAVFTKTNANVLVLSSNSVATGGGVSVNGGQLVIDGATVSAMADTLRWGNTTAGSVTEIILTNNASVQVYGTNGSVNARMGNVDLTASATQILTLAAGTLAFNGAHNRLMVGGRANNYAVVNHNGGVLSFQNAAAGGVRLGDAYGGATGVYYLNGGTLQTPRVDSAAPGSGTFNFNGGTLQATTNNTAFMAGLTAANVLAGGAVIDTAGYSVTVAQGIGGAGGLVKKGAGALSLGGTNGFTGPVSVDEGILYANGINSGGGDYTVAPGALLGGTGTINISLVTVQGGGTIGARGDSPVGMLGVTSLDLRDGATASCYANGTNPTIRVFGFNSCSATNCTIQVVFPSVPQVGSTNKLIDYSGTLGGAGYGAFTLAPLPGGATGYLTNNVSDTSIDLVITGGAAGYRWTGAADGTWDIQVHTNWAEAGGGMPGLYYDFTPIAFDDTGSNTAIAVAQAVSPDGVTVSNDAVAYSFAGAPISGSGGLAKLGAGTLTLGSSNAYTGPTSVQGGVLRIGSSNALGAVSAGTEVLPGAALDLNGSKALQEPLVIRGDGIGGAGALVNNGPTSGGSNPRQVTLLTLAGDSSIGGTAGYDLGAYDGSQPLRLDLGGFALRKVGTNSVGIVDGSITNGGSIVLESGSLTLRVTNNVSGAPLTVRAGTTARFRASAFGAGWFTQPLTLDGGTLQVGDTDGANRLDASPIAVTADGVLDVDGGESLVLSGAATGAAGLTKIGGGALYVRGTNTYSGLTVVSNGYWVAQSDAALGDTAAGTEVRGGATLQLELPGSNAVVNIGIEPLSITGIGVGGTAGVIRNYSGTNSFAGPVTLTGDSMVNVNAGQLLLSGSIGGNYGFMKTGAGVLLASAAQTYSNLTVGGGSMILQTGSSWVGGGRLAITNGSLTLAGASISCGGGAGAGANVVGQGGGSGTLVVGSGDSVTFGVGADLRIAYSVNGSNTQGAVVINGGTLSVNGSVAAGLRDVAGATASTGTLTIAAGTVTVTGAYYTPNAALSSVINLDGGELRVPGFRHGGNSTVNEILFNGGRLVALAAGQGGKNFLPSKAEENTGWTGQMVGRIRDGGAVIDSAGFDIVCNVQLLSAGTGGLTKLGAGMLTLKQTNTYDGATLVSNGVLRVDGVSNGAGACSIAGGTLLTGTGTISRATVAVDGGGQIASLAGGMLTVSNLNMAMGSRIVCPIAATTSPVRVTGAFSPSGMVSVDLVVSGPIATGQYAVVRYGTLGGDGVAALQLNRPAGSRWALSLVDNPANSSVDLLVSALSGPTNLVWKGSSNDVWDLDTTTNWVATPGAEPFTFANGDSVLLDDTADRFALAIAEPVSPAVLTVDNSANDYTIGGAAIGGAASLVKTGSRSLVLAGSNTYSGVTTVSGGTLQAGDGSTNGAVSGPIAVEAAGRLLLYRSDAVTYSNSISGAGAVAMRGADSGFGRNVALTGNLAGLQGAMTVATNARLINSQTISGLSNLTMVVEGGGQVYGGGGSWGAKSLAIAGRGCIVDAANGGIGALRVDGGTYTGAVMLAANAAIGTITSAYISGPVSGGFELEVYPRVGGAYTCTVYLAGNNSYASTRVTRVDSAVGVLVANGTNGVSPGPMTLDGGVLRLSGYGVSVSNLSSTAQGGIVQNGSTNLAATLTVGADGSNTAFGGTLLDGATAALALTKTGTGELTLLGTNLYTGATTVNGGSLKVTSAGGLSSTVVTVGSEGRLDVSGIPDGLTTPAGRTLQGSGAVTGAVTMAGTLSPGAAAAGTITFQGLLTLTNAALPFNLAAGGGSNDQVVVDGDLNLAGTNVITIQPTDGTLNPAGYVLMTYSGALTGDAGNLVVGNAGDFRPSLSFDLSETGLVKLVVSGANVAVTWSGGTNGLWNAGVDTNWNANTDRFFQGDATLFDDTGAGVSNVTVSGALIPASILVNATGSYTFAGSGKLSGTGGLVKDGPGMLTITNSGLNDYAGATVISNGTLRVSGGSTAGRVGPGPVQVEAAGTFLLHRGDVANTYAFSNSVAGAGTWIVRGTGASSVSDYDMAGDNSGFSGTTIITNARYKVNSNLDLGTGPVRVQSGGQIFVTASNDYVRPIEIAGTGWQEGAGLLGAVRLGAGALWSGDITLAANSRITAWGSGDVGTVGGMVSGPYALEKTGNGTIIMTASNSYSGGTTLAGGTLRLTGGDNRLPTNGTLTVTGTSTLNLPDIAQGFQRLALGSNVTSTVNGAGWLILRGTSDLNIGGMTNNTWQTLDMSALSRFTYDSATKNFYVNQNYVNMSGNAATGTVRLAADSTITASTIGVNSPAANANARAYLLLNTNTVLNASSVTVGNGYNQGQVSFLPGVANPTLRIRGTDGVGSAAWTLGQRSGSVGTVTGVVDLVTGVAGTCTLDALLGSLNVGTVSWTGGGTFSTYGVFSMGGGVLQATAINLATHPNVNSNGVNNVFGTFSVAGGTVRASTILLGDRNLAFAGTVNLTATFNLNSNATVFAQSIQKGNDGTGTEVRTFNWNDGTIANYNASTDLTISGLTLTLNGTGRHEFRADTGRTITVAATSSTAGTATELRKTGAGRLSLAGGARFGGSCTNLVIEAGVLSLGGTNIINAVQDIGGISVAAGSQVDLPDGGTEVIGTLVLDAVPVPYWGTYGSTASKAEHKDDTYFSGPGMLRVLNGTVHQGGVLMVR